jgi:hypothetical protein
MNTRDRMIHAIDSVPHIQNVLEPILDRVIALIKSVGARRVQAALDVAHSKVDAAFDEAKRRQRADEPTLSQRINDTGAADE